MEAKLNFDFATQQVVLRKIAQIDSFNAKWSLEQRDEPAFLQDLRQQTLVESTGSSTRIEGSTMTDIEVQTLLKHMKITKLNTRDEQEVAGYYEVLALILDAWPEIPLTENFIFQLHGLLLKHSVKDQRHRGAYKSLSNQVIAKSPDGTQEVVFNTTVPHLTPPAMQQLLQWVNDTQQKESLHPLLLISVFVYEFLSIHPFQDGNGRLSRLLTTLLLLRADYNFVLYSSFEHLIEERKKAYYRALMHGQAQRSQTEEHEVIDQWVVFFLDCLVELTQRLTTKRQAFYSTKEYLNERQKRLLSMLKEHGGLQMAAIEGLMADTTRATLKRDLSVLLERRHITRTGAGRGVRYFVVLKE